MGAAQRPIQRTSMHGSVHLQRLSQNVKRHLQSQGRHRGDISRVVGKVAHLDQESEALQGFQGGPDGPD